MMLRIALVITALGAACTNAPASDGKKDAGPSDVDAPPLGDPIDATAGVWTFVDFPDSSCDDGSSTGIGVNIGTSNNLLVFFSGGGACWDFQTCFTLNTAEHGPFKKAQLDQITQGGSPNTVVDRSDAANPFQDWSYVFVPYCTGDIHAGDVVQTYTSGTTSKTLAHVGHKNVLAYLERIGATFKTPDHLVVSGSSAGGGSILNYPDFKRYYPNTPAYLIDDSLPFFQPGVIDPGLASTWATSWDLATVATPVCGDDCLSDFSQFHAGLAALFPHDRMALLSSQQDATIRQFDGINGTQFQTALTALQTDVLAPSATWKTFTVTGQTHTMLLNWHGFTDLETWVTAMVTDAAWTNQGP